MSSCNLEEHLPCQRQQPTRQIVRRWLTVAERVFWIVVCLLALFSGCATIYDSGDVLPLDEMSMQESAARTPNPLRSPLADRVPEDLSSLAGESSTAGPSHPLRRPIVDETVIDETSARWVRYVEPSQGPLPEETVETAPASRVANPTTAELVERARRLMSQQVVAPH